ncbi:PREDICTED: (-)-alpha-pinene synthase-like [Fragaria vesca subsp. vesca]|uniref:(-)-alpha-pinene synthase-like n=1 Tax=Fragaria vesca subsp. vesca TaxID=101020 RepID=UPI0002C2E137|nr:PREDICTED: (-)-alpha-pinene synthase-like [Fragaria vesca subsp. vesca]
MPVQATPAAECQIISKPEVVRRTANFKPSVWGDRFTNYAEDIRTQAQMQEQVEELKQVVRKEVFTDAAADSSRQLKLIAAIQRLGVAYHFETEIEQALERIHATYQDIHDDDGDLYNVALRFRLLRRHGYNVSCDVFNKFKDTNGDFKKSLVTDVSGMLCFYEAAHLRVHGETLLEEALVFTTTHLESASAISSLLKTPITEALERPLLKTMERLGARRYMSIYQDEASHSENLLKLAKLDFNVVQCLHKKELSDILRWYKELDFARRMPFARDRVVELFFWIAGIYFEPQYVFGRHILTKLIEIVTVMDDMYDAFGTFEELVILTEAIDRWDASCMDQLPDYMQPFYITLLDVIDEVEEELTKQGRSYRIHYAKDILKNQARLYFAEARWFHEGCTPKMDEYMRVAASSVGNTMLSVVSLVGMGDIITKEEFEWLTNEPKILRASNTIFRLMDDIAGYKFEKERGHVASSIDCYMNEYGVSEQETIDIFNKRIVDSWKDINEEFLRPTAAPVPVLNRVLNLTRVVDLLYKRGDAFTHVGKLMKDCIAAMFIDPVPL